MNFFLVTMILFSFFSYSEVKEITTNVEIQALIGVNKIEEITISTEGNIDFENLRNYSGEIKTVKFTIKDLGLENKEKKQIKIQYTISSLTTKNNSHTIKVNQISPIEFVEIDNQGVTTELKLTLDKEEANRSPNGNYEGSVIIKTIYTM